MTAAFVASGNHQEERAANLLDGGAPFYDIYETSDGKHMSVGALEPQFYDQFVELLGIKDEDLENDTRTDPRFQLTAEELETQGIEDFQLHYAVETLRRTNSSAVASRTK